MVCGMFNSEIAVMAMVAFALTACSDGENAMSISPDEWSSLNNIAVEGHVTRRSSAFDVDHSKVLRRATANGSIVRMSELDSVILDTTGVFFYSRCDGSIGEFSFDGVTLRSPYVKLELAPDRNNEGKNEIWSFDVFDANKDRYVIVYTAIVDLRESRNVDINAFTYLESFRMLRLVHSGHGAAEAKSLAEHEILDAVGLSDESYNFDKRELVNDQNHLIANKVVDNLIYEWSADASPLILANTFANKASFATTDLVKEFFIDEMNKWKAVYSARNDTAKFMDRFIATLSSLKE